MKFLRYLVGIPLAIVVTGFLFILMHEMIREEGTTLPEAVEEIRDTWKPRETPPPPPDDPIDPKPDLPEPPDTPDRMPDDIPGPDIETPDPDRDGIPGLPGRPGGSRGGGNTITPKGFYPILRATPLYPASCAAREVEGQVTVQYDVTNGGVVVNAIVVESTDGCLDRAALRAIEGWKYSPLLDADPDGIRQSGLTQTFEFELEDT